jgi:hypothetical protein
MSQDSIGPRTGRPARPRTLSCPNCGGVVTVQAAGLSVSAACASCGSVIDVTNDAVRLIEAAQQRTRVPRLAIGTRGTVAGTEWQVVGYQERSSEGWAWEEYLLFNPYRGFRFLTQDHGHWTLYGMLREAVGDDGVMPGGSHRYQPDNTGVARTDYVLGEFYWRARAGDSVSFAEFVDAPFILSKEQSDDEVIWSRGVYLEPAIVKTAFPLLVLPPREGRMAHQPDLGGWLPASGGTNVRKPVWKTAAVFCVLLLVLESVSFGQSHNLRVFQQSFVVAKASTQRSLASPVFIIPDTGGNAALDIGAPVWPGGLKLDLALAAADGSQRFDMLLQFSALSDPDVALPTARFASVPGGRYQILADADATALVAPAVTVTVTVRRHTPDAVNFLIALALLLLWPTLASIRRFVSHLLHPSEQ